MTLQEAKDKAAYNLYSKRFDEIQNTDAIDHRLRAMELAAELYARSKWDEGQSVVRMRVTDYNGRYFDENNLSPGLDFGSKESQDIIIEDLMNEFAADWYKNYDDCPKIYEEIKSKFIISRK